MKTKKLLTILIATTVGSMLTANASGQTTQLKPEITHDSQGNMLIKNGVFTDMFEHKVIAIKNANNQVISYLPANLALGENNTVNAIATKVVNPHKLEVKKLKSLGKITTEKPKKKPNKKRHPRKITPKPGNPNDLIPSLIDFANTVVKYLDLPVPGIASLGSLPGSLITYAGLSSLASLLMFTPVVGSIYAAVGSLPLFGSFVGGLNAITMSAASITAYTMLAVYAGKNISDIKAVKRAANRVANNLKAVAPFFNWL